MVRIQREGEGGGVRPKCGHSKGSYVEFIETKMLARGRGLKIFQKSRWCPSWTFLYRALKMILWNPFMERRRLGISHWDQQAKEYPFKLQECPLRKMERVPVVIAETRESRLRANASKWAPFVVAVTIAATETFKISYYCWLQSNFMRGQSQRYPLNSMTLWPCKWQRRGGDEAHLQSILMRERDEFYRGHTVDSTVG